MPEFVLNRNYTLAGKGHMINFVKGQPTWVPPELAKEAAGIGAEAVSGDKVDPLPEEEAAGPAELEGEERNEAVFAAFDLLREKNDPKDFGGDNRPLVAAVNKVLGFDITKKERDSLWPEYTAKLNAE